MGNIPSLSAVVPKIWISDSIGDVIETAYDRLFIWYSHKN